MAMTLPRDVGELANFAEQPRAYLIEAAVTTQLSIVTIDYDCSARETTRALIEALHLDNSTGHRVTVNLIRRRHHVELPAECGNE
jgi:hypothetical protein